MLKIGKYQTTWRELFIFALKLNGGYIVWGVVWTILLTVFMGEPRGLSLGAPFMVLITMFFIGIVLITFDVVLIIGFIISWLSQGLKQNATENAPSGMQQVASFKHAKELVHVRRGLWRLVIINFYPIAGLLGVGVIFLYSLTSARLEELEVFLVVGLIILMPQVIVVGLIDAIAWAQQRTSKLSHLVLTRVLMIILAVILSLPLAFFIYRELN